MGDNRGEVVSACAAETLNLFDRAVHANSWVAAWHASLQRSTRARVRPDKPRSTETPGQCTTARRTEFKESRRLTPNFLDEPFDFLVKTGAKLWPYIRVISDRLNCIPLALQGGRRAVSPPGYFGDLVGHFFARDTLSLATADFLEAPINLRSPSSLNIRCAGMEILGKTPH